MARSSEGGDRDSEGDQASHSYRFALFLILVTFVLIMAAPDESWTLSVTGLLLTGTLIVAVWTSGFGWSGPKTLIVIAVGVAAAAVAETVSGERAAGAVWLAGLVFAAAIIAVMRRHRSG